MNWVQTYIDDLTTQEKRTVRQKLLIECQLSKSAFYGYLDGKQGRAIVMQRIQTIVEQVRKKEPIQHIENALQSV